MAVVYSINMKKCGRKSDMTTSPTHSSEGLDCYSSQKSFMEVCGISRTEAAHSRFLAWLFTNRETCEQGIKRLIALLKSKSNDKHSYSSFPDFLQDSWEKGFQVESVNATLEEPICVEDGDKECADAAVGTYYGRVDLVMEVKHNKSEKPLIIVIENKIDSQEHPISAKKRDKNNQAPQQTVAYARYYSGKENCLFGYLTLTGAKDPEAPSFIHFTYQDVLDQILVPLLAGVSDTEVLLKMKDYIRCLESIDPEKGMMAVGPNQAEATVEFWQRNHTQFSPKSVQKWKENKKEHMKKVLFILSHILSANLREDIIPDKKKIENINSKLNSKDYTRYKINGEGNYSKNALVYEVVKRYIENHPKVSLECLQKTFNSNIKGQSEALTNMVVISEIDYLSKKREDLNSDSDITADKHWKVLSNNDGESYTLYSEIQDRLVPVYVCQTGWNGPELMDSFISDVNNLKCIERLDIKKIE